MVKCSICGREVRVIPFGTAFIAVCCGKIIYRGYKRPKAGGNAAASEEDPKNIVFLEDRRGPF